MKKLSAALYIEVMRIISRSQWDMNIQMITEFFNKSFKTLYSDCFRKRMSFNSEKEEQIKKEN